MRMPNGIIMAVALAFTIFVTLRSSSNRATRFANDVPPHEAVVATEIQKPVGWVFGRLIGVPGADQPLLTSSGTFGGRNNLLLKSNGR